MAGEPTRVTTAGDSAKCRERWGRIIWRMKGQCNGGGRCVESGRDEDVELHDGGYCDVGLYTGVGGRGGVGDSVGMDGTERVGRGGVMGMVVVTVIVQGVLEVDCMGVVSGSSSGGLSGGGDDDLGGGRVRWWIRYRFPRVFKELLEDLPNILSFLFNFRYDVALVSLERRSGECD